MNSSPLIISGTRVRLRALQADDLNAFLAYRQDPDVCRYQGFDPYTVAQAQQFLKTQNWVDFSVKEQWMQIAIEKREEGQLIGDCALRFFGHEARIAEMGCTLNADYQGQGLASEALKVLINHLYQHQLFHKIIAIVDARNRSAINLLERLAFKREAIREEHYFDQQDQAWVDEWEYALLAKNITL